MPQFTLEEFGKKVKEKYPQYKDISDTELAEKILQKYPSYQRSIISNQAQTKQPTPSPTATTMSAQEQNGLQVGDLLTGVGKSVTSLPLRAARFGEKLSESLASTGVGKKLQAGVRSEIRNLVPAGLRNIVPSGVGNLVSARLAPMAQSAIKSSTAKNTFVDPTNEAQRRGQVIGDVAQAFLPVGGAAKGLSNATKLAEMLSMSGKGAKALGAAGKVLGSAGEAALSTGIQTGDTKSSLISGGISAALPLPLKAAKSLVKKAIPTLSGVEKGIFADVFHRPDVYDAAADVIAENPKQPLLGLAKTIGEKISSMEEAARSSWVAAADAFKKENPNRVFNLEQKLPTISEALDGFGLKVRPLKSSLGKFTKYEVAPKGSVTGYSEREIINLNSLFSDLRKTNKLTPEDVLEVRGAFSKAYNAVPLDINGNPTRYHAAVMAMKDKAEQALHEILPPNLKAANAALRDVYSIKDKIGNRIFDNSGEIKQGAESFLSSLGYKNKGAQREIIDGISKKLGIDINDTVDVLQNAQKISEVAPRTGSRSLDILRSLGVGGALTGAGVATMNPLAIAGGIGTALVSSPMGAAALTKSLGRASKKIGQENINYALDRGGQALYRLLGKYANQ